MHIQQNLYNNVLFKHSSFSAGHSSGRKGWNLKVISFLEQIMLISLTHPNDTIGAFYGLHLIDANRLSVVVPTVGGTAANSYQKSIFYCCNHVHWASDQSKSTQNLCTVNVIENLDFNIPPSQNCECCVMHKLR